MIQPASPKLPYQPTSEDGVCALRRLGWYAFQCLLFFAIVYRIGPNLFMFQSIFSPGPQDFVPVVNQYAPIIASIKAYNRDFGKLPFGTFDLPPEYRPPNPAGYGEILNTTSITFGVQPNSVIEYEFSPEHEGWIVHSPRYDGPVPVPIVPAGPKPATQPSTSPATRPYP